MWKNMQTSKAKRAQMPVQVWIDRELDSKGWHGAKSLLLEHEQNREEKF